MNLWQCSNVPGFISGKLSHHIVKNRCMGVSCKTGGGKTRWVAVGLKWTDITGLEL